MASELLRAPFVFRYPKGGLFMTRRTIIGITTSALAFATLAFAASPAHAGIEACGNIDVKADAQCKVEVSGGCTAKCEPVSFEAACAGKLEASCSGKCNADISADCSASCGASCKGSCTGNPGSFDCKGSCSLDCEGSCSASCQGKPNGSECQASCKAQCGARCDASCQATPPSATCDAKCEASCSGSCKAKANVDCSVNCQASGYVDCKAKLSGGCKAQCEDPKGALFCNGNYVDTGGNLENCIAALNAILKIRVDASATGSCSGNSCEGEANVSVGACEASPGARPVGGAGLVVGVGALAFLVRRRRRPEA